MDDKVKVMKLYEKMNRINNNMYHLIEKINYLEETLETNFKIDGARIKKEIIDKEKKDVIRTKNSVKYTIITNLQNYF